MKSVYNALMKQTTPYLKKDMIKEGVKSLDTLCRRADTLESIKDKTTIRGNEEQLTLQYKPSLMQQKINDDFNYVSNSRINNFIQYQKMKQTMSRQFSTVTNNFNQSEKTKQIQAGGDFAKLVTKSTIFADKSLFIKEVIEDVSEVLLITMPRRWGKSCNMDMLKRFLSNNKTDEDLNKKIFEKRLAISKQEILVTKDNPFNPVKIKSNEIRGTYPVIFINFGNAEGQNIDRIKDGIKDALKNAFEEHSYLLESDKLDRNYKDLMEKYIGLNSSQSLTDHDISNSLKYLTKMLHRHWDQKVWVLIDEYDAAINNAYMNCDDNTQKETEALFKSLFKAVFKDNSAHLEKGVVTGVLPVAQSGVGSGFNNATKINITNYKYAQYYGLNGDGEDNEIEELVNHFFKEDEVKELCKSQMKAWYNGYNLMGNRGEKLEKYNVWSSIHYLNDSYNKKSANLSTVSYWEKSGATTEFFTASMLNLDKIGTTIESLLNKGSVSLKTRDLNEEFVSDDFKALIKLKNAGADLDVTDEMADIFFHYLFVTGYLTLDKQDQNKMVFPNMEIKSVMQNRMHEYFKQKYNFDFDIIRESTNSLKSLSESETSEKAVQALNKFFDNFKQLFSNEKLFLPKGDTRDTGIYFNEDAVHSLLNTIAFQVRDARVSTEETTKKIVVEPLKSDNGRMDVMIRSGKFGMIIEVKHSSNVTKALEQAKNYKAIKDFANKIYLGVNISEKFKVEAMGEISGFNGDIMSYHLPTS